MSGPPLSSVAVMGDLIGSEAQPDRQRLHRLFNAAVEAENRRQRAQLTSPLTITLGDEFQGLTSSLASALELTRHLRLSLLAQGVECRFAIGRVRLSSPVNRERAWNMMGQGLAETRERLNDKAAGAAYRFYLGEEADPLLERLMEGVGRGLTHLERGWTARQRTVMLALMGENHTIEAVSVDLKVTARTIYKVRDAAGFEAYRAWWTDLNAAALALDKKATRS
jgi:hypothetical protein